MKRPGLSAAPAVAEEMPWEGRQNWPLFEFEEPEPPAKAPPRAELLRSIGTALGVAVWPLLLIVLGELLYPPLTRSLALFSLPSELAGGLGAQLAVSVVMIVIWVGEAPFVALLTNLIGEMYEQKVDFLQTLLLHPRIQSVRALLGTGVFILGVTGMVQPMYLLWVIGGAIWGTFLVWKAGRELHSWRGWGSLMVPVGFFLYQALGLLVYFLIK